MIYVSEDLSINEKMIIHIQKRKDGRAEIYTVGDSQIVSEITFYEVLEKIKEQTK